MSAPTRPAPDATVTLDLDHDHADGARCTCGLPVVLRYESKGTVHYDHARDVDLPRGCADAAALLAHRDKWAAGEPVHAMALPGLGWWAACGTTTAQRPLDPVGPVTCPDCLALHMPTPTPSEGP